MKCAFVGEGNFNIIKMHGTTIKKRVELFNSALAGKLCVKVEDLYSVFRKYFLTFI
jgi:hypothetical protein